MRLSVIFSAMATSTADLGKTKSDTNTADGAVLTVRPDMRPVKAGFLVPLSIVVVGIAVYLKPVTIDADYKLAGLMIIATLASAGITGLLLMYEALANATYRVTSEHIEEEYGIINKRVRRIPLIYVRDVTYDQSFAQAMFGISSITVSRTNGDKIVLCNIREGEGTRETIWNLVLSRSRQAGVRC